MKFIREKTLKGTLGRVGKIETPHGVIETPAFVTVGTKATVKALTPEQVASLGAQVVLANTYHLYLEPGEKIVREAGGLGKFMNWSGPTMTDSGGFQVFSLGVAFGLKQSKIGMLGQDESISKFAKNGASAEKKTKPERDDLNTGRLAKVTDEGVVFRSHIDGSEHFFTPEKSMDIQRDIGADIIFAFDECTSPVASYDYQRQAMDRTHAWAKRSLDQHQKNQRISSEGSTFAKVQPSEREPEQALFGIVQGGRFQDLREESAKYISSLDFAGFGIGGSFDKEDMDTAVGWVNAILPDEKPRHMLGIGEPADLFGGIENGCDLFDCVAPTRIARNGQVYTKNGKINLDTRKFAEDFSPIEDSCPCYTCANYTKAYLSHLFRGKEMLASTLATTHNLFFIVHLVQEIRQSILDNQYFSYKETFLKEFGR